MAKPIRIIVHATGGIESDPAFDTSNQTFEVVNNHHKNLWNFKSALGHYLGYQYFIDKNGKITQARKDDEEGAHTIGQNQNSIGICLAGNFDYFLPTDAQVFTLKILLLQKTAQWGITEIVPHRKFAKKSCYGNKLSDTWAADLIKTPIASTPCVTEKETILKLEKEKEDYKSAFERLLAWVLRR